MTLRSFRSWHHYKIDDIQFFVFLPQWRDIFEEEFPNFLHVWRQCSFRLSAVNID